MKIKEMTKEDRPVYRIQKLGPEAVSTLELLTTIGRFPDMTIAHNLLKKCGTLRALRSMPIAQMCEVPGCGPASAAAIKAALALPDRLKASQARYTQITSPAEMAHYLIPFIGTLRREELWVVLLNTKNYVVKAYGLYRGAVDCTAVRVNEFFSEAITHHSTAIVLAHNHPSGDPTPSPEDITVSKIVADAGVLLGIEVLDHIIVGTDTHRWVSLKERGVCFD